MSDSIPRLSLLGVTLFSLLAAVAANALQYPTTLEVDIVFPRNDTYAPVHAFPLVIAIQNNSLSQFLKFNMTMLWAIFHADNQTGWIELGSFQANPPTSDDPRYLVSATTKLNNTEGRFRMNWMVVTSNCSITNVNASGNSTVDSHYIEYATNTYFTLQNAAQPPDLVAATSSDTCASIEALVLNITGATPLPNVPPIPGLSPTEQLQCPVFGNCNNVSNSLLGAVESDPGGKHLG
ncbi:hypothetical protein NUW58_g6067 [Xylaria curta]|uniref:Uncharacterized protein n=1 Tax=Xylaria curta TaxID=42375 RepID=A0ACC1NZU3_9PEZI|nr:hypothetical protein NUW58_g6067 [Xylaria curta]